MRELNERAKAKPRIWVEADQPAKVEEREDQFICLAGASCSNKKGPQQNQRGPLIEALGQCLGESSVKLRKDYEAKISVLENRIKHQAA